MQDEHGARLVSVNVVHALIPDVAGHLDRTAIDKRPVPGPVHVRRLGVEGDSQYDVRDHGGPDKAVYAYAVEDARWWEAELGRHLPAGSFGENLTTEALDVTGSVIGERWRIGDVLLQVVWPRIPCRTFAGFWGVPDLVKRFTAHGAPGAYLRVVEEGALAAGERVEVVSRPGHGVTLGEVFRARMGERTLVPRMLEAPELPVDAQDWARRTLGLRH